MLACATTADAHRRALINDAISTLEAELESARAMHPTAIPGTLDYLHNEALRHCSTQITYALERFSS